MRACGGCEAAGGEEAPVREPGDGAAEGGDGAVIGGATGGGEEGADLGGAGERGIHAGAVVDEELGGVSDPGTVGEVADPDRVRGDVLGVISRHARSSIGRGRTVARRIADAGRSVERKRQLHWVAEQRGAGFEHLRGDPAGLGQRDGGAVGGGESDPAGEVSPARQNDHRQKRECSHNLARGPGRHLDPEGGEDFDGVATDVDGDPGLEAGAHDGEGEAGGPGSPGAVDDMLGGGAEVGVEGPGGGAPRGLHQLEVGDHLPRPPPPLCLRGEGLVNRLGG